MAIGSPAGTRMVNSVKEQRRLPIGAEVTGSAGVHFRVWAPRRRKVEVVFEENGPGGTGEPVALAPEGDGYFAGTAPGVKAGARYRFRLDGREALYPDPASRYQPAGPHGPSEVVDPQSFEWTDDGWDGIGADGQVLYEMHVGTFTPEGTWVAAGRRLAALAELGVTCLEVMPVAECAGTFGWGYDGVDLFAPNHPYGTPDDMRRFVDRAHALGMGVILDVVYNHFGPDGCYLGEFAAEYFTDRHKNDWGEAINFDGPDSGPVREFFLSNVEYWLKEFHLDGFRFDATQAIVDDSPEHIFTAISRRAREAAARRLGGAGGQGGQAGRKVLLVAENEPQQTCIVRPPEREAGAGGAEGTGGGFGLDTLWNDDFHHSAMVAMTGHTEAYYTDHLGAPQEFISAAKWGYLFQGQRYAWQGKRRGTPALDLPPTAFVNFIQNHDQVANSGKGLRAHALTSPAQYRAMTGLMLLMPQTPMLFQGQEFAASSPFYYFADHKEELRKLVRAGRAKELSQFPSIATEAMLRQLVDPGERSTFERSKIDWRERERPGHAEVWRLHADLLRLRREEPVFRRVQRRGRADVDGAVLGHGGAAGSRAFVLRYFGDGGEDRLVLVNLGDDLRLVPAPEPLLAPPAGKRWVMAWSSEDPAYGGAGTPAPETEEEGWLLMGRCTVVLRPVDREEGEVKTRVKKSGTD